MAYGYRRRGRGSRRAGKLAHVTARKVFRRMIRKPKRVVVKKYANTVGQIVYVKAKKGRSIRPSHGGGRRHHRRHRRY